MSAQIENQITPKVKRKIAECHYYRVDNYKAKKKLS